MYLNRIFASDQVDLGKHYYADRCGQQTYTSNALAPARLLRACRWSVWNLLTQWRHRLSAQRRPRILLRRSWHPAVSDRASAPAARPPRGRPRTGFARPRRADQEPADDDHVIKTPAGRGTLGRELLRRVWWYFFNKKFLSRINFEVISRAEDKNTELGLCYIAPPVPSSRFTSTGLAHR